VLLNDKAVEFRNCRVEVRVIRRHCDWSLKPWMMIFERLMRKMMMEKIMSFSNVTDTFCTFAEGQKTIDGKTNSVGGENAWPTHCERRLFAVKRR